MSELQDVIHGFITGWRCLTAEPCQRRIYLQHHPDRNGSSAQRLQQELEPCGNAEIPSLGAAFFNSSVKEFFGYVHIQNSAFILPSGAEFAVFSGLRPIRGGSLCCSQIPSRFGAKFGCRVSAKNGDSLAGWTMIQCL